jgi:hypothetical protein
MDELSANEQVMVSIRYTLRCEKWPHIIQSSLISFDVTSSIVPPSGRKMPVELHSVWCTSV